MATRYMGNSLRNTPQGVHAGVNEALFRISSSVTVSVGDTWVIGKIPHGAIPTGAVFFPAAQANVKFGISSSLELFFVSDTYSTAITAGGGGVPSPNRLGSAFQISVSDDAIVRYENVTMVAGTTDFSLGYFGDLVVRYIMPGQVT